MKIRTLPREFLKQGFLHTQLERTGAVALYSRGKDGRVHYEVVKIKAVSPHPNDALNDGVDLVERYPLGEEWGRLGWTYVARQHAEDKFYNLVVAQKRKSAMENA